MHVQIQAQLFVHCGRYSAISSTTSSRDKNIFSRIWLYFQGRIFDCINLFIFSQFYCWRNMKMRRLTYAALKCRRRRLGRCSFIIFRSLPYLSARFNTSVTRRRSAPVPFIFSRRRQQVDRRTNVSRKSVVGDTHTREREVSLLRNITPPDNFWLSPTMTEFITIIEPLSFYIPPPPSVCICAYIYSLQSLHLNTPMAH
jgi:hypothetical protein